MKYFKLLFIIILCHLSSLSYGQLLSFDQLISLQTKGLDNINDYLTSKDWEFSHSSTEDNNGYFKASWAYGKSEWENGEAIAWLKLTYKDGRENLISYQIHNKSQYLVLKKRILDIGMKQVRSWIEDNSIYSLYSGKNYMVVISQSSTENSSHATYIFDILKKNDFIERVKERAAEKIVEDAAELVYEQQDSFPIKHIYSTLISPPHVGVALWDSPYIESSNKVYDIPKNSTIYIIERGVKYHKAYVNGHYGFISNEFLVRK